MKLTVLSILLFLSFSALAFTPESVKCLKDAKKAGQSLEDAYQSCSLDKSTKKRK